MEPQVATADRHTGVFRLPADPLDAVAINDANRHPGGSDLWGVDELVPQEYQYTCPTFAPIDWAALPGRVTQSEYSKRFASEFGYIARALPIPNVVVAGGAAAWALGGVGPYEGDDVDLFFHGLDPKANLWETLADTAAQIVGGVWAVHGKAKIAQALSPGALTIFVEYVRKDNRFCRTVRRKIQIILRAYESVSAILHAFDLPSCAVAYDGTRAVTTTLGAYACVHRVNVVVPAYRSTTYETRLAKYFSRGYALALPHLRPDAFAGAPKGLLVLPHLALRITAHEGPLAVGRLCVDGGLGQVDSVGNARPVADIDSVNYWGRWVNLKNIHEGHGRFVISGVLEHGEEALPAIFAGEKRQPPSMLRDIVCQQDFLKELKRIASTMLIDSKGRVDTTALRDVFGLSSAEAAAVDAAAFNARKAGTRVSLSLGSRIDAIVASKYDPRANEKIDWWLVQDPGRQFTASVDPRMESPAEWYGVLVDESGKPGLLAQLFSPRSRPSQHFSSRGDVERLRARKVFRACPICERALGQMDPLPVNCVGCNSVAYLSSEKRLLCLCGAAVVLPAARLVACPTCLADKCPKLTPIWLNIETILRRAGPQRVEDAGRCGFCLDPTGEDRLELSCGHVVHWGGGKCGGVKDVIRLRSDSCGGLACRECRTPNVESFGPQVMISVGPACSSSSS